MAIIYNYPENEVTVQAGERIVADHLKKLSNDYYVYYSLKFVKEETYKKQSPFKEIDFIIAHPDKGILICEVKNLYEDTEFNSVERAFIIKDRFGKTTKINPYEQCNGNYHNFLNKIKIGLRKQRKPFYFQDILIGQLVLFPAKYIKFPKLSIFDEWAKYTMDIEAINNEFEENLDRIFEYWRTKNIDRRPPGMEGIAKLRELTETEVTVESIFNFDYLQFGNNQIKALTDEQEDFVNSIIDNDKFLVNGCAGSGKTFLAIKLAEEFANQNYNVLFLTFNKMIYEWVRQAFEIDKKENILMNEIYLYYLYIFKKNVIFLNNEEPAQFDVVIIDEGQDFSEEHWDEIFEKIVIPNQARIFVFYDDQQGIFERNSIKYIKNKYQIGEYKMTKNIRNSKSICQALQKFNPEMISKVGTIGKIQLVSYNSLDDLIVQIDENLKCFLERGIQPSNIIFLNHFHTKSRYSVVIEEDLKEFFQGVRPYQKNNEKTTYGYFTYRDFANREFFVHTINRYKGLESDIVFLLDIESILKEKNRDLLLYTAVSRAKIGLIVFHPADQQIVSELGTLFQR